MHDKIVLVTGANSGMGLSTSVELARRGAHVIMVCRNAERGRKAMEETIRQSGSKRIELMLCDLGDLGSIRRLAVEFEAKYPILDVLINNAGVVSLKRQLTVDGFEMQLGVNHLGHFLLTNLLLGPLQAAKQGRVVNVSSGVYKVGKIHFEDLTLERGYNVAKGYARSKLANILFTKQLAVRLKGTNVTANCLHPGAVGTSLGVDRQTGFGKSVHRLLRPFFLTPEQGAETGIYLATASELSEVSGEYYYKKEIQPLKPRAMNMQEAEKLWIWSEQQVGL
ncbi:SDR family oxidoreductase [Paenibacillus sp. IHBB 10380]|uniref:SDR family oxidoreductase n=1 Tax=Paenibacillus sp. IHBB 10380 TaxID=1566358 RepID=UPI0005CFE8EF|nr:SDR family oxidoreductase [Paenibacillus sp. IHBB 10380]AJS59736.1 short-chain dehydrogenase [Paenibacillus sp. IHBB 10380]